MATTFKALRIHQIDKNTAARLERVTLDELSAGEVVIRVAYSSLNYKDALAITGKGRIMRKFPCVAGIDLSGVVEESRAAQFRPGDRVLVTGCNIGEALDGGLAEYARLPAEAVVPLPTGLSLLDAMALGTAGFTAALALRRMFENHQSPALGPIAVSGPTGGVGSVAINLLSHLGFSIAALTGKKNAENYLRDLGANEVVERTSLGAPGSKPLETARWGGAVDNLGGDTLAWLTRTVRPWGNIACIGLAQSAELHTTVMPFILRGVSLLGIHSVECPRPWRLALWEKLAGEWKPPRLAQIAPRIVALEDVSRVCEEIIAGKMIGRTVVRIGSEP